MFFHFILISNNYVKGLRIGWHFTSSEKLDPNYLNKVMEKVQKKCGNIQFGVHKLITDSSSWKSVIKKDSFFSDILIISSLNGFIKALKEDNILTANNVAKFILSIHPMSHLRLQKILYYAFAEHLLEYQERLFPESISAFKYGPVVEEVFHEYKHYGSSKIDFEEDDVAFYRNSLSGPSSMLKVLTTENGVQAANTILKVLLEYGDESANDLVTKTHSSGGPWDRVYVPGENNEITEKLIMKYHHKVK